MADDNTLRQYRSTEPLRPRREPAAPADSGAGGDPLAELARLIGQNDPFAEFGRDSRRNPDPHASQYPQYDSPVATADWRSQREPRDHDNLHNLVAPPQHYAEPQHAYTDRDPYPDMRADPRIDDPHAHDQTYREPQFAANDQRIPPHPSRDEDQYYQDDAHLLPQNSEMYDDPPKRRSSGLLTVVALIVCALIGTAGAYAYRTYYGSVDATRLPRTIEAEKSPSKVAVTQTEPQPKASDRIDNERVVPRQEQPVELREPPGASQPRVIFPNLINTPPNAPTQATPNAPPQKAAPVPPGSRQPATAVSTEPKRVRTVTIRPNAPDPTAQAAVPPPVTVAPSPAGPPPAARTAPAPRVVNAPTRPTNAPLSLAPVDDPPPAQPPQTRTRVTARPAVPTQIAPGPAARGPGGYAVQVSSQRSEAEANASYRTLQAQFSVLRSQPHFIKRADLGSKGVYYRAMVGPFASADEAGQFCSSLKAAGGQCVIQRN